MGTSKLTVQSLSLSLNRKLSLRFSTFGYLDYEVHFSISQIFLDYDISLLFPLNLIKSFIPVTIGTTGRVFFFPFRDWCVVLQGAAQLMLATRFMFWILEYRKNSLTSKAFFFLDEHFLLENRLTLRAMSEFGLLLAYYYLCDRTDFFGSSKKSYNRDRFLFLYFLLIIVSAITSFTIHNDKSPFWEIHTLLK